MYLQRWCLFPLPFGLIFLVGYYEFHHNNRFGVSAFHASPKHSSWPSDTREKNFLFLSPQSSFDSKRPRSKPSPKGISDGQNNQQQTQRRPKGPRQHSAPGLNNDLFRLRQQKNGIPLAERRLESALQYMQQDADKARRILQKQENLEEVQLYPNEVSFNSILSSHAKNSKRDWMAPQKAEQLLRRMQGLAKDFPHLEPTIFSYNAVLEAYSKNANSYNLRRAQQSRLAILRLFRDIQQSPDLEANTFTYNLVLTANAQSSQEWQTLERWAVDYLDDDSSTSILPDRNTYNQLLRSYADVGNGEAAQLLLHKIVDATSPTNKNLGYKDLKPRPVWFNLALKALVPAKSGTINATAGNTADALLIRMYELQHDGYGDYMLPDTSSYNHVLNVHSRLGNTEQAEALVEEMERLSSETLVQVRDLRPDLITFTTLIKTYATKQRQSESSALSFDLATNATRVFKKMQSLARAGRPQLYPSDITYNTLISIWANVGTRDALHMAMELFQEMTNDPRSQPDSITYTTLIHGWSRGVRHLARLPEAGYRAESLLQDLEQLPQSRQRRDFSHTKVFNSVITAWSKSGEAVAAKKVESLLAQLEGKYFNGQDNARPDKTTFLCMIDAYAKAGIADAEERCDALLQRMSHYRDNFQMEDMAPDRIVYNVVLNALAKSCQASAVEKAEEILTMMQASSDDKLRPDIVTYATVIDCHTKCGEGSRRADELLRFVEGSFRGGDKSLEPNAVFYSAILQAWAKTATAEGATKAEELLRRNLGLYEEGLKYAKPHAIMYNAVMDAIARTGDETSGKRAEELLHEMETIYQGGDNELKPSRRSFNAVILAYRNEGDGGKKAEEILSRMEELAESGRYEVTPDVVSYNCAISAIVDDSKNVDSAADRAQALLDRMEERGIRPDGRTYSPVIAAWLRRNDEKGHALAEMMLQQFLDKVESSKHRINGKGQSLYEDAVWDVINAYRKSEEGK